MKRILVVDNDESTVDAIADLLRDTDYDALTATTGEQALTMLFRLRPDLLILDMFMPGMSGWQVLDAMAGDSLLARMPKVAMTAWPFPIDLPPGVALLHKPFEWESLARLVRTALRPQIPRLPRDLESSRAVLLPAH
jgi:CheY-like chemotaxis protein